MGPVDGVRIDIINAGNRLSKMNNFFQLKIGLWGIISAICALACICTVTGFMGRWWWVFDLSSHFRVQYFLLLTGIALVFCFAHKFQSSVIIAIFAGINLMVIVPLYFGNNSTPVNSSAPLRAMLVNVHTSNKNYTRLKEIIAEYNPDFILLEEVDSLWLKELDAITNSYPYSITCPRDDNFGIAMLSRIHFEESKIVYIGNPDVPSVFAQLDSSGKLLTILGIHPLPPVNKEYARWRKEQLSAIPEFIKSNRINTPLILLGDLNATPWSFYFKQLLKETGLQDSTKGWGVQPTWPTILLPFLIPIDHFLHSSDIHILKRQIGNNIGSDHYPVIVDFKLVK